MVVKEQVKAVEVAFVDSDSVFEAKRCSKDILPILVALREPSASLSKVSEAKRSPIATLDECEVLLLLPAESIGGAEPRVLVPTKSAQPIVAEAMAPYPILVILAACEGGSQPGSRRSKGTARVRRDSYGRAGSWLVTRTG